MEMKSKLGKLAVELGAVIDRRGPRKTWRVLDHRDTVLWLALFNTEFDAALAYLHVIKGFALAPLLEERDYA